MPGQFDAAVAAHGSYEYLGTQETPLLRTTEHVVECNCSNPDGTTDLGRFFRGATQLEAVEAWVEHVLAETVAAAHAELAEIEERIASLKAGGSVPPPTVEGAS